MSDPKQTVVIPMKCAHCDKGITVECEHVAGFSVMHFYTIDCPHCGKRNHRQLPGDIVDVRPRSESSGETA